MSYPEIGSRVRIERDETKYPSKGTWPQFRGKAGTVVEFNHGEIGVCFGKVWPRQSRPGSFDWQSDAVAWFQPYEVTAVAPRKAHTAAPSGPRSASLMHHTRKALSDV